MQRRTFLSLLALPALAQLLQACGDDSKTSSTDSSGNSAIRAALKGTAPRIPAGANEATDAAASINAFAADLYERLVALDPMANLVFSPASIALALTMTSAGATGTTLDEMNRVLHITDPATIHRSMNGLSAELAAVNRSVDNATDGGTGTSEVQLSIANSLWGQAGLEFEQTFLDLLSAEYDAGMELVDYATDPEAARAAINQWVATRTKDRIPELLSADTIMPDTQLTLVNATYLKANWAEAFAEGNTVDEPFAGPAGDVTVQMMHTTSELAYGSGDGWQAVDIPYVFGDLAFTVAIGDTADVTVPTGDQVFATLTARTVQLGLPRFDIESAIGLADVLRAMGMPTAFEDAGGFSGITTARRLFIAHVVHQANITVDEEGTEAAAATAVIAVAESAQPEPQEPVVLTVDRPFTFWLRDTATDTIVFMGRVNDPSATR